MGNGSCFRTTFFRRVVRVVRTSFLYVYLISKFLCLTKVSNRYRRGTMVCILGRLSYFFKSLKYHSPSPFRVNTSFFRSPLMYFRYTNALFNGFVTFARMSYAGTFFGGTTCQTVASSTNVNSRHRTTSFFTCFYRFYRVTSLRRK